MPSISHIVDHTVSILSPSRHHVFDADYVSKLDLLYQQLYPDLNIISISPFYQLAGHATLCGDILGSVMNASSCQSSSTIMAFWPLCNGNVSNVDYVKMRVGCIQYFCQHQLTICTTNGETITYLLLYVGMSVTLITIGMVHQLLLVLTVLNLFLFFPLFLYGEYLLLVHIAKQKLAFLD